MSSCSNSVNTYIVVEASDSGSFSGLTLCGGGGLTVDFITGCTNGVTIEGATFNNNVLTVSTLNADIVSGGTYYGIVDSYMTGGTYSNGFITFSGSNNFSDVTVDVRPLLDNTNIYVTGYTYNNANTFTISQNNGTSYSSSINQVTGLTVNGTLTTDVLDFNINYTGSTTTVEGRMFWDKENQTVSLGLHNNDVSLQLGQEQHYHISNQSGATLENGRVIRAAGTLGASGRILGEYMIADGTIPPKFTLGIATHDIVNGDEGYVTEFGLVRGINTTGSLYGETWNDGDVLWVSPTIYGGLTNVEPLSPNLHIEMAVVIRAHSNGSIFVRPHRYPYSYDLQDMGWSAGTENHLDVIQWNGSLGYFELTSTPTFVSISASTLFGDGSNLTNVVWSGNTSGSCISDIYVSNLYGCSPITTHNDIEPNIDNTLNLGSPTRRFRSLNSYSGKTSVWEVGSQTRLTTNTVETKTLDLGQDLSGNTRQITADNSIIQDDVLYGGTF